MKIFRGTGGELRTGEWRLWSIDGAGIGWNSREELGTLCKSRGFGERSVPPSDS